MSKFKVGDVVRRRSAISGCWQTYGGGDGEYEVLATDPFSIVVKGVPLAWGDSEFELVREPSPKEVANHIAPELSHNVQYYIPLILQWGRDRGILDNSTPLGQSRKTHEEVRELVEAASKMQAFFDLVDGDIDHRFDSYETELADAIGDIFVTLVMVAGCAKLDINACVAQAYEEIKNRKGKMNDKGVWVKEEEQGCCGCGGPLNPSNGGCDKCMVSTEEQV